MAGGSRFNPDSRRCKKTRRITYCDSSCFCPRHHLLYLYRPVSTHIFGIHAAKQKRGLTDSLMRQKGVHVSAVTVNWDNSRGDFLQSEINCPLHLEKSEILHTGFTERRQAIFPQRRRRGDRDIPWPTATRRRFPDNPTLHRENNARTPPPRRPSTAHGPFANPQTTETSERVLRNGRRV